MVTTFKKNDKETLQIFTVTISSGQTVSNSFDLNGMTLVGIELPAAMTSNTMFIQDSTDDGVTFKELYNTSNSRIEWSITANKKYALLPYNFCSLWQIKIGVNSAEASDRTIKLICRGV